MADVKQGAQALPDWWARETQKRQLRFLLLLVLLLALIGFYYYLSALGVTGIVAGINFDSTNHLVFVRQQPDGNTQLYAIRADGTDLRPLTPSSDKSEKSAPAWTLDGKNVLYSSNRQDAKKTQIYLLGTGDPRQLTYGTGRKDEPIASPDGKHIAFLTQGAIKTVNLNGTEVEQFLPAPRSGNENAGDTGGMPGEPDPQGPYQSAAYSSDGTGIAGVQFLSAEGNMDVSGSFEGDQVARVLTPNSDRAGILDNGHTVSLSWEPNGKRLMTSFAERMARNEKGEYVKDKQGRVVFLGGITVWSFETPNRPQAQPIMLCQNPDMQPRNVVWSPDGTKLAFEGWKISPEGNRELRGIYIFPLPQQPILLRTGDKIPPPSIPAGPEGIPSLPHWAPFSSRLMFQMQRPDHKNDLWVVNIDGTNPINLTKGVGDNTQGQWAPVKK